MAFGKKKSAPVKKAAPKKAAPAAKGGKKAAADPKKGGKEASKFLDAIKKKKSQFNEARKAKAGTFELPDIADGTYIAQLVSAKATATNKGIPQFKIELVVLKGEYEGVKLTRADWLRDDDEEVELRNQQNFAKNIQGFGIDTSELEESDLPELAESLMEDKPFVRIGVSNWQSQAGKPGINVYINQLVDEEGNDIK